MSNNQNVGVCLVLVECWSRRVCVLLCEGGLSSRAPTGWREGGSEKGSELWGGGGSEILNFY